MAFVVAAFYRFVGMGDIQGLREVLQQRCEDLGICGTILLAAEGINGTIAGERAGIEGIFEFLRSRPGLEGLGYRESMAQERPFSRLKVKVKREIVTLGQPMADPTQQVGTYVSPQDWNAIVDDPDVIVIDTRNDYEVGIGSFVKQQPKVAMFCTGGIRCEKASAYLLSQGFEEVYHLQGGILSYLEQVPEEESRWEGECYVFDERVSVVHGLAEGTYDACTSCGHPLSEADCQSQDYVAGLHCPHCVGNLTEDQRSRFQMRLEQRRLGRSG
jgi:UPF0176 protein